MTSPVYTVFAQQFLPTELWVPFFTFMQFLTGVSTHTPLYDHLRFPTSDPTPQTYFNTKIKRMQIEAAAKAKKDKEPKKD